MIIGIISDTHDRIPLIEKAIERLKAERVKLVLHAGDYVSPFTAKPFAELEVPMIGVFGNNCAMTERLKEVYAEVGCDLRGYFTEIETDDLRIAMTHGHIRSEVDKAKEGDYDVVVQGHWHRASVARENGKLLINPGEVCGYLTGSCTVAFLDTEKNFAWISEIK
jgi:putative phosphoesterase